MTTGDTLAELGKDGPLRLPLLDRRLIFCWRIIRSVWAHNSYCSLLSCSPRLRCDPKKGNGKKHFLPSVGYVAVGALNTSIFLCFFLAV